MSAGERERALDAREAEVDIREADADDREDSADDREDSAQATQLRADADTARAGLMLAEANVALQAAKEHLNAAESQQAAADHKTEDAERLMSFADDQLATAAAKLAEATSDSDSEEYQRALYHYTQLVRHRMANPLHIIGGAAATLQAQPELDSLAKNALLAEIYKQTKILERVCLEPKVMHPSENGLEPMPATRRPPG
jgi:signal transduction histidine kinase